MLDGNFKNNAKWSSDTQHPVLIAETKTHSQVLFKAFHYYFHTALHIFACVLQSALTLSNHVVHLSAMNSFPVGSLPGSDIQFSFPLASRTLMDAVLYATQVAGSGVHGGTDFNFDVWSHSTNVSHAKSIPLEVTDPAVLAAGTQNPVIDQTTKATVIVPVPGRSDLPPVTCDIVGILQAYHDAPLPLLGWCMPKFTVPTPNTLRNLLGRHNCQVGQFHFPWLYHQVTITPPYGPPMTKNKAAVDGA
ncbi:hypothetical protein M427DRAFT_45491 [Gonapodya prolifera JEL478]|uniref:Uncharacterized protein n=1 Tax=Gonapodya prolifera (strain JEL478) TaxID=1344416 RepID=A0A139AAN0_GONPJ|nr:hypothetical protein M427DRAFT_45491 [Gonapodya prolifera JEL478]|eukprot:KXS13724.1 hypothetical protein M427DRAFT_45491 [Gonapodya prolifera JEL478]